MKKLTAAPKDSAIVKTAAAASPAAELGFGGEEFLPQPGEEGTTPHPYMQILNPPKAGDDSVFGMAIKIEQAALCGWNEELAAAAGWERASYWHKPSKEGEKRSQEEYWLSKTPRFLVLLKGELTVMVLTGNGEEKTFYPFKKWKELGEPQSIVNGKAKKPDLKCQYIIMPLGEGNVPLVDFPVSISLKGAVGAIAAKQLYGDLKTRIKGYYPTMKELLKAKMSGAFKAHCIVNATFESVVAGKFPDVSDVAGMTIQPPNLQELSRFVVAPAENPELSRDILEWMTSCAHVIRSLPTQTVDGEIEDDNYPPNQPQQQQPQQPVNQSPVQSPKPTAAQNYPPVAKRSAEVRTMVADDDSEEIPY